MSNAIEIRRPEPQSEWALMREQAQALLASRFLPKAIQTAEQAVAIIQTGKELGLGPMQSLRGIWVLDGKPVMSSAMMAALMLGKLPGSVLRVVKSDSTECVVAAARPGQPTSEFRFSIEDAKTAGLTGKDPWRKYPRQMLQARCIAEAVRATAQDCIFGIYTAEELDADVNEAGEIQHQVHVSQVRQLERRTPDVSPHGVDSDLSENELGELVDPVELMDMLIKAERLLEAGNWASARNIIGAKGGSPGEFGPAFSVSKNAGKLSAAYSKDLGKLWGNISRRIEKFEKADLAKPVDVVSTLTDDDPAEDFPR